jgi:intracellular sulfur oxidation DsrE/DsrF family protein
LSNKVAIFIYESLAGDMSRAYRGLKTALEFVKAGDEVAVVFDGSGVETLAAISDSSSKLNPILEAIKDSVEGACSFCVTSHKIKDVIDAAGYQLLTDFEGEASVRKFVSAGYTGLSF